MKNQAMQMMLNQLRMRNPQAFQMINKAMSNNSNPMDMLKQVTSNYDDKTKELFMKRAEGVGFPKEYLDELFRYQH